MANAVEQKRKLDDARAFVCEAARAVLRAQPTVRERSELEQIAIDLLRDGVARVDEAERAMGITS